MNPAKAPGGGPEPAAPGVVAAPSSCSDDAGEQAKGGVCVHHINGQVTSMAGAPLTGLPVTLCAGQCFIGKTDATGHFAINIGQYIRKDLYSLSIHGQPSWAAYYVALPAVDQGGEITFSRPLSLLPMPAEGPEIARDGSAQTLTAGGVTLTIPPGTDVQLSTDDAANPAMGGKLRPMRVTAYEQLPFLGDLHPDDLYVFAPFEVVFSKPVRLTLDNTARLPAGTPVELLQQRGVLGNAPPGAAFMRVATGHVSADARRIEMDENAGTRELTWLAVRRLAP